jgi:hypothetical protein
LPFISRYLPDLPDLLLVTNAIACSGAGSFAGYLKELMAAE